ncbi:MAG: acyl carrier protein [Streptosporangiaceae bacterium]|jgi:acyl carrier protein
MAISEQEIFAGFAEIIEEVVGVPAAEVTPDASLADDLDIDSLSMVEIVVTAEGKFDVEIPDAELEGLTTVYDVVNYLLQLRVSA